MPEEEEFEYTKGVIRIRKSKNSQCIVQTPTHPKTDLQITTQKTKDRATRTPLKTRVNSCSPEGLPVPAPHLNFIQNFCNFT
jgi:hypothetical protein